MLAPETSSKELKEYTYAISSWVEAQKLTEVCTQMAKSRAKRARVELPPKCPITELSRRGAP